MQSHRQEQPDLTGATIYKVPASMAAFFLVCSGACTGLIPFLLYKQRFDPLPGSNRVVTVAVLMLSILAFHAFRLFRRFLDRVAVNNEGIFYLSCDSRPVYLPWSAVARIDAQEGQQRLVLRDPLDKTNIRLEYQIENFSCLRDFVVSHATNLAVTSLEQKIFHRSWYNKCVLIVFGMLSLVVAGHLRVQLDMMLLFLGLGIACLVLVFRDPTGVEISAHRVDVTYLGWKQPIPFNDVTSISLQDVPDGKGNVWAAVVVARRSAKPIKLFRFKEGSLALRDALQAAWKEAEPLNT